MATGRQEKEIEKGKPGGGDHDRPDDPLCQPYRLGLVVRSCDDSIWSTRTRSIDSR